MATFLARLLIRDNPVYTLLLGYIIYIVLGWIALCLPFCQGDGSAVALDHLFTAVSAVSTTGLVTVTTPAAYNQTGNIVILTLIQFGGIGYMTFGTFFVLAFRRGMSKERKAVGELAFALPKDITFESLVRRVVGFTLMFEVLGALALYWRFTDIGQANALWHSVFQSVSAFCTAGFSTFPNSLESFVGDFWINAIISVLSIGGALAFIVLGDVFNVFTRRRPMTFTSAIILVTTFVMIGVTALILLVCDPGLSKLPLEDRVQAAWFQAMTAMTTVGFNTYQIGALALPAVVMTFILMLIGASPSGTGGGMKTTTFSAMFALVRSNMRGRSHVELLGRRIPDERVRAAACALVFYITFVFGGLFMLSLVQEGHPEDLAFEVVSALGTVGLSRGTTGELNGLGKLVIIFLMYAGRVGPITLGLALLPKREVAIEAQDTTELTTEDVAV